MRSARFGTITVLAGIVLVGCKEEKRLPSSPPPSPPGAQTALNTSSLLKHKMECRTLGMQADKEQFPEGRNTPKDFALGFIYFDPVFAYSEKLNTCLMLSGYRLTNLETVELTAFQATLTDLLSNNILETYLVFRGGKLAPASVSSAAFLSRARELLGEPLPLWLEQAPTP